MQFALRNAPDLADRVAARVSPRASTAAGGGPFLSAKGTSGCTVGGLTEETRVVADTPLLETTTATRSQVIDKEKVENLPLAGRNPYALAYTIQGVTTQFTRPSISARPFDNGGMDAIAINGGRNRSNELLLDGAPNTSREGGSQAALHSCPRRMRCRKYGSAPTPTTRNSGAPAAA